MKTRNLWPLGIVLAFAAFIAGTFALIVVAASNRSELVTADYYDAEIRYQRELDGLQRARAAQSAVAYDSTRQQVIVSLPPEHIGRHNSGGIVLYRPAASNEDRNFDIEPDLDGRQVLDVSRLPAGPWGVRVSWQVDGVDYLINERIIIKDS